VTLHDIGKRKAAFPKLLFYIRRRMEGVKTGILQDVREGRFLCGR
jgi:hypothetical protein